MPGWEEDSHNGAGCPYTQAQGKEQLSPQASVATPLPLLPPGSPPSREIWDWLVHPEGNFASDLPWVINTLRMRDGERWEDWEQQHNPASVCDITMVVLGYLAADMGGMPSSEQEGEEQSLPSPPRSSARSTTNTSSSPGTPTGQTTDPNGPTHLLTMEAAVGPQLGCHEPGHIARMCPAAMECNVATCYLASETDGRGNGLGAVLPCGRHGDTGLDTASKPRHPGGRLQTEDFEDFRVSIRTGLLTPLLPLTSRGAAPAVPPTPPPLGPRPAKPPIPMGRPTSSPWMQRLAPSWGRFATPDLLPYQQRDRSLTPGPSAPIICFRCHELGHIAPMCPSAMECNVATCYLASEAGNEQGNGQEGPCIIDVVVGNVSTQASVDSGCAQTLIQTSLLGGMSWQPQGKVAISCIHGDPTLKAYVSIGQTQRHLTVGVVERLPHPVSQSQYRQLIQTAVPT
ncbi:UNVERIFIED_CONTAM: hypothetical protein FKN15_033625 [Acipenser sinensis]